MKKLFTLPFVFILFLFVVPFTGMAQANGDYRSAASGNWNTPGSWQVRDNSGNWSTANTLPTALNNVYIQNGHTITLDVTLLADDGAALSLHINTLGVLAIAGANNVKVSGKIRCFTGAAEVTAVDGVYIGTSSTATASTMITTTSTGLLKFIGASRIITNTGEWNSSGTNNAAEFALDAGAIDTLAVGCKFKNITFSSGTVFTTSFISAASGDLTIKNGARVISSRSGTGTGNAVIANSSTQKCGIVTIDDGGILELTGTTPSIDCTTFNNNGTVIYSKGGSQTMLQKCGGDATATAAFGSYSTLVLAVSNTKTPSSAITVSKLLQFTGSAAIGATAALTLTMLNKSTVDRSVTSGTSIPSTAGAVFYGAASADTVNVTIGSSIGSSNEFQSAPTPGKIGTLTINPGVVYTHGGSRTVINIVNNGQIVMTPSTSMTLTIAGTISGTGIYSSKLSVNAPIHYATSFVFTGRGPVGTLKMKQVADSNHLRSITLNSVDSSNGVGGLILGNPIIVDTSLTLTKGVLTNGSNLTLGTGVKITRGAGSLSAAPTFGANTFSITYNDATATTTGFEMPTSLKALIINNAAGVTLNSSLTLADSLKLSSGKLTIPAAQSLRITSGFDVLGAPFSNSKYVVCDISGANVGKLRIDNITTAKLFPIGTTSNYLPVTVTPSSAMDYEVSVFTGATADGLPTGTPLTLAQKNRLVDAVWTINRMNGTGNCDVQTNWPSTLEGSAFTLFANSNIGIARHNGTSWDAFIGSGDNAANTATATFSSFSPFLVGELNTTLPVTLKSVSATVRPVGIDINWKVENESSMLKYEIEKSKNGFDFTGIGMVDATNKSNYNFTDASILTGVFYYRIKMINTNGSYKYSYIISVKLSNNTDITIYPNPVANTLLINGLKNNNSIKIVNSAGQIVLQQNANTNSLSMDVSSFKPGIYAIQIASENEKIISKTFIKE